MTAFGGVFAGKRVLVTGHTGFKGSWLTAWLLQLGARVCGISRDIPTEPSLFKLAALGESIDHRFIDVRDGPAIVAVVREFRPDFVFHLAAQAIVSRSYQDPLETISTNIVGTACVLQALRDAAWPCAVVIVTSDKCYENVEWEWGYRETDALGGKDIYSASKGGAELIFHAFHRSFFSGSASPVRLATARAGNVIGGGDWASDRIVVDCIRAWTEERPVLIRSPRATRPWQHVLEPLSGYLTLARALHGGASLVGESFNFGPRAEQNRSVVELIRELGRIWGLPDQEKVFQVVDDVPFNEAGLLKLNCDKALFHLRWEPNLSYHESVEMTGQWYLNVLKAGANARALTFQQVDRYERVGKERGRVWAH
jgi:CDP-glucose 4,6-dehydratase